MIIDVDEFDNFQPICKYTIQVLFFLSLDGVFIINLNDYSINYFLYLLVSYWINQCSYLCIFLFTTGVFYMSDLWKFMNFHACMMCLSMYLSVSMLIYVYVLHILVKCQIKSPHLPHLLICVLYKYKCVILFNIFFLVRKYV